MQNWLFLAPALTAGILVLLTHIPLGRAVLQRGIIFIDLAIAQIAGLGVIAAYSLGWEIQGFKTQIFALVAAIGGAYLLGKAEKLLQDQGLQEALIGISFVLSATAVIILLANNPHGGEQIRELLVCQILWTTWNDLIPLTVASLVFGLFYWRIKNILKTHYFYLLFATIITFSVQIVGVYLVFSSLVIPAFAFYSSRRKTLLGAFLFGVLGYIVGLVLSVYFDLPTGATIVWILALLATLFLLTKKMI